jgi:hypothetical protein
MGGSLATFSTCQRSSNLRDPPCVVDEKVRREKALDFSGCNSRPGTGSLHPVAIEAAAEATKLSAFEGSLGDSASVQAVT